MSRRASEGVNVWEGRIPRDHRLWRLVMFLGSFSVYEHDDEGHYVQTKQGDPWLLCYEDYYSDAVVNAALVQAYGVPAEVLGAPT